MMKNELSRLDLIVEYDLAPDSALFSQKTVAAIRQCSLATIERDRWAGIGIKFIKMGRLIRYRKSDIREWMSQHQAVQSTTESQHLVHSSSPFCSSSGKENIR